MKATVKVKDLGFDALMRRLRSLKSGHDYVRVGVVGQDADKAHDDSGLTNAQLAAIHEFGAPAAGIPERSFLRSTLNANQALYASYLARLLKRVVEGKSNMDQALGLLGLRAATDVKKTITEGSGIPPPLKAETIARKGSDRPLVDTGRLLGAITWEVVKRGR